MNENFSSSEMREAVRKFFEDKGFTFYDDYDPDFEPARVPVYGYKKKARENLGMNCIDEEGSEKVFVDIITEPTIKVKDFFDERHFKRTKDKQGRVYKDASSAGFYRHYFPTTLIYWAITSDVEKDAQLEDFKQKCKGEGIGVLEVSKKIDTDPPSFSVEEIIEPCSLINGRFKSLLKFLNDTRKTEINEETKKELLDKLMEFSDEDLTYLVFYPEPKYYARDISDSETQKNISKELILKMGELNRISYRHILIRFSQEYNRSTEDDYTHAFNITTVLWEKYSLKFPRMHIDYEQVLKLDPTYRDHFLHSFQVFMHGVYIIDQMYDEINNESFTNEDGNRIEDAWLLAATYHDYNYMIQKFDNWTKEFFKNALYINEKNNPVSLQLSESYIKEGYMLLTKELARTLSLEMDQFTLDFLFDRILVKKNHGLISSLSLLKYLKMEDNKGHKFKHEVIFAAAKAIAIHDKKIWEFLSDIAKAPDKNEPSDEIGTKFKSKKVLENISVSKDPIPFLLILSDSLQEEGREIESDNKSMAELEKLFFENKKITTEISFNGLNSYIAFKNKTEELENVRKFLRGNKQFAIVLKWGSDSDDRYGFNI